MLSVPEKIQKPYIAFLEKKNSQQRKFQTISNGCAFTWIFAESMPMRLLPRIVCRSLRPN